MTRFVVRPTGPSESDGYSVVDTNREDADCPAQIGRGLSQWQAHKLLDMLAAINHGCSPGGSDKAIRAILAACADAHDDYLSDEERHANREASDEERHANREASDEERHANREASEKSGAIASVHRAALLNLLSFAEEVVRMEVPDKALLQTARTFVLPRAREALGE